MDTPEEAGEQGMDGVLETLELYFGFTSLRPGQNEVVEAVMQGRDALAIMPTGGGKSLCYQLPALCRGGVTIVVSPLIALMKDQVDALVARGIPAAAINSSLGADEYRQVMADFRAGTLRLVYVAPERFGQEGFMNTLSRMPVSLLAIDEAHCLSQWGHDFRPDYLRLGRVREALGCPQTIALTATATQFVREDILRTLQLREPAVIVSGFGRENLDFAITHCDSHRAKYDRIRRIMQKWKTGIVYCSTRKNVMRVYDEIRDAGLRVVAYHAGMTDEEREFSQNDFISGRADVVVATNAFGMGIDRADVRFVVHFEIPGSVEAYYQEAGRAGRDGEPAVCELLFNHVDLKTQEFFFEGSNPPLLLIRSLYHMLCAECSREAHELQWTVDEMAERLGKDVNPMAVGTALSVLIHAGAIQRFDVPGRNLKGTRVLDPEVSFAMLPIDSGKLEEKARRDHLKIEAITKYAYSTGCRQQWILEYFGEKDAEPCGHCDSCRQTEDEENLPDGWRMGTLGEIADFAYGKMPNKTSKGSIPIFSGYGIVGYTSIPMYEKQLIVVIARGDAGSGKIVLSPNVFYLTNLAIAILLKNDDMKFYLFYHLLNSDTSTLRSGSAQAQVTINSLYSYEIIIPSNDNYKKFNKLISSVSKQKQILSNENMNLTELQSLLLAKMGQ